MLSVSCMYMLLAANNIWVKIRCDGEKPSSRDGHACTCVNENLIIHGGFAANVSHMCLYNMCMYGLVRFLFAILLVFLDASARIICVSVCLSHCVCYQATSASKLKYH